MATLEALTTALDARTSDHLHLQPLDSVLNALQDCTCTWCCGLLSLLRSHLESDIPVFGLEVSSED